MKFIRLFVFIIIPLLFLAGSHPRKNISCREIVGHLLDSIKNIKTQRCEIKSVERSDGHIGFAESQLKLNVNPKMIYYKNVLKGNELLWVEGKNKGNALIHARSLPMMNLNLDPHGSIMRKESHHSIFDLGFQYIGSIFANSIVRAPKDFDKHFAYAGSITWNHIDCYQVIISFPEYKYIEYITLKGENVNSIAKKFSTSDYKIRNKNELSGYFGTIKEGKKIVIPTLYGNKVVVYIDKKSFIPINVKIYDEEGLFESYEFYNVKINSTFSSDEFSENFTGYGF